MGKKSKILFSGTSASRRVASVSSVAWRMKVCREAVLRYDREFASSDCRGLCPVPNAVEYPVTEAPSTGPFAHIRCQPPTLQNKISRLAERRPMRAKRSGDLDEQQASTDHQFGRLQTEELAGGSSARSSSMRYYY
eukprot:scaffold1307_cov200-Pinguiococcus_pyrenoidosus.AAC.99